MGKIKNHFLLFFVCFLGVVVAFNRDEGSKLTNSFLNFTSENTEILPLSASISGTATVCLNENPLPQVTFTGSGGNTPYTFTYSINAGAPQTISTTGTNESISVDVMTNAVGVFIYELISVTDGSNDTSSENGTATITVASPPDVSFTFNNNGACSGTPINFTSNVVGDGPFTYDWQFGDGTVSSVANPTHIYNAFGCGFSTFTAELTVTDSNGCTDTTSQTISVEQRPELAFEDLNAEFTPPFDNCGNNTVDPAYTVDVGNISPSDSCVTSYDVNWGDGTAVETNVTFPLNHTYTELGSFNMVITGYGDSGCISTETILVKNSSNPTGGIINPPGTVNLCLPIDALDFKISSWGSNPPDTTYSVDFGDGTQEFYTQDQLESSSYYNASDPDASQNFPIPHEYTQSNCPNANYFVTLVVATSCGETLLTAGPIIILEKPNVDFEFTNPGCVNTAIQFTNTTEGGYGPNCTEQAAHSWDFGDGTTSDLESPSHTYTSPGTYSVTLVEENFCGTTDPVTKTICIEPGLVPTFTVSDNSGCVPFNIDANDTTNLTESCGGETYLWEVTYASEFCGITEDWEFTNGTDETSVNPSFQFNNAGIYELTMTVTNSCGDFTTSQTIEVKQPPTASISEIDDACGSADINPIATVDTCAPSSETITYSWSFPGGSPATSNQLNPGTISYTVAGDYTVTFTVTNDCGATTTSETFSINESPNLTNTDLIQTICSGTSTTEIVLTSDNPNTTFSWSSNNPTDITGYIPSGTSNTIPVQTLVNTSSISTSLIYTVIPEINGCAGSSLIFEIIVEPAPLITDQPLSDAVCLNGSIDPLSVTINGTGTATYQWYQNTIDNNTSGTLISGATSSTFLPPTNAVGTTYYYVVISFTTGGCSEIVSDTAAIEVADLSQIDTQPISSQSICIGGAADELEIIISGGTGNLSYQWYSNTTNTNTGGTIISGATLSTYIPPEFTTIGSYYYYVEIIHEANGCSDLISDVAEIIVVDDPEITTQPIPFQSLCQNSTVQDLEVIVSGGLGNISYQWYVNTVNDSTSGTPIVGATASVYSPPTDVVSTLYYYCVITQDVSGCEVTSAISEIEISAGAQFTSQPISDELCLGETTVDLSISYTNGTGTPSYQWYVNTINDTATGTLISGAEADTFSPDVSTVGTLYYYAIITFNSGGCSEIVSNTAEITVNVTPSVSDTALLICSGNTFEYTPDESNGDIVPSNIVYTWTNPVVSPAGSVTGALEQLTPTTSISQFLENITVNPATVTYTVTPIVGDCVGEDFTVAVTVNPSISVTSTVTNNTCFQSDNASIEIDIVGGIPFSTGDSYSITWSGPDGFSSTNEDIFNLAAGTYNLDIQDDGGCPYTETFTITEPDELVFSDVNFDPETISCFGANDGEIGIDILGGTAPYTYNWTLNSSPFSTNEDLTNLGPGDYSISVSDANNCGAITLDFTIIEPDLLEVSLDTKTDVICYGDATGAIAVNVVGGRLDYNFSWTGPSGFTSPNQNIDNLIAGVYNLTVTDSSGCIDNLEVEILQNDEINIQVTTTEIECYGDNDASITIDNITGGVAPYDIAWSNFGSGNSQTNLSAGIYTITITDAENCERAFPIEIEEAPIFLIEPVVTQMTCAGENDASITLNFQGGIDPVNLVWDDDSTAGTERNNLAPGTYSVTITDGAPCIIQESFTIYDILPLQLSANVSDALDCDDANSGSINLIIQGGTPPFNVSWSNNSTTEDLNNVPPNTYVANVVDANGCEIQGSWTVNRFEPLVLDVDTQSEVDCETRTVNQTFQAIASGGVPPYQYNWSTGNVSGSNNELMTTDENGLVLLEVIDTLGCTTNYSFNVDTPVLGDANFTTTSFGYENYGVYAIQDPIQFTNTATGDYESILWDFGDGSFSSEENPIHTYFEVGSQVVTQTVTYPFGCVYTKVVALYVEEGYKLIMPDAFTPNGDGLNDYFTPVHIGLNSLELSVFDTWGSLIYKEVGDAIRGWDGMVKEEVAENGNYYYTFSAKTFYGDEIKKQGAFVYIK